MRRAVVQLGAGPIQRGLVAALAEAGLVPIVVDRAERPAGLVPGARHVRAPIDSPAQILPALRALLASEPSLRVGAVLTSTDLGVASVPAVARALGLPHAAPSAIEAMDDKQRAKRILAAAGLRVPTGGVGRSLADLPGLLGEAPGAEVVVKPVDASGSRGVRRVRGRAATERAVDHALRFSDRFLLEACVEGDHLDVNGHVRDGVFELVSIGRRFFSAPPACVPVHGGLERRPPARLAERVQEAMQRAVDAFGYRHGPVKADAIDSPGDGLVLLELAARFHGDVFSHHVAEAAGRAPAALHWLARLGLCAAPDEAPEQAAWVGLFAERAGTIARIEGLDRLRAWPGFHRFIPRLGSGDVVGPPEDNRALVGFGILRLPDEADPWQTAARQRARLSVELVRPAPRSSPTAAA